MSMYWSLWNVPELAEKTKPEREAIIRRATSLSMRHWEWWIAVLAIAVLAGLGGWLGGKGLSGVVGAGIGGGLGGVVSQLALVYVARKYHSRVLAGLDAA